MRDMRIHAVRLACRDIAATMAFYRAAFGADEADGEDGVHALRLGDQRLEFAPASADAGPPPPSLATGFQHCAIVVSRMEAAMARLRAVPGWQAISQDGPQALPAASGGATAFKFRDPEGHPLEFLEFPTERVPEPWRSRRDGPCLGIDHSAITVRDVDRSIRFYEARGFRLAGRQRNQGPEQGRLDGLGPDTSVEVVTLVPAGGAPPHLELLGYRIPEARAEPVPDGSPFATVLCLSGDRVEVGAFADPDGHRFRLRSFTSR